MCNLYLLRTAAEEVGRLFGAEPDRGANVAEEMVPGYPGLVVTDGRVRAMAWGFPLVLKGRQGQPLKPKAVTNAREDKLGTAFWRDSFAQRRCLIPMTQWAEAEGARGRMTRTWYGLQGRETFAVAGLWRPTAEWGAAYAMVMADSCPQMLDVHDRMPVILAPEHHAQWLEGDAGDAFALCRACDLALTVERSREVWAGGAWPAQEEAPRLL